jgi:hypothetical protein
LVFSEESPAAAGVVVDDAGGVVISSGEEDRGASFQVGDDGGPCSGVVSWWCTVSVFSIALEMETAAGEGSRHGENSIG